MFAVFILRFKPTAVLAVLEEENVLWVNLY